MLKHNKAAALNYQPSFISCLFILFALFSKTYLLLVEVFRFFVFLLTTQPMFTDG